MATSSSPLTGQQPSCHPPSEYVHLVSPFPFLISTSSNTSSFQSCNFHSSGGVGRGTPAGRDRALPNSLKLLDNLLTHLRSSNAPEHEINHIQTTLTKLSDKKLASQRFVPSQEKTENLSKLALGAKLDRALARRMGGQDAVMRVKGTGMSEKVSEKITAN